MNYRFSSSSNNNMRGVHSELIMVFNEAIQVSPIDFGVPSDGGVRTARRQNELFVSGKSKCDGYKKLSNHQIKSGKEFGEALDFYAYVGKASWSKPHLALVAGVILSTAERMRAEGQINIKIRWGGTFGSKTFDGWDYPHIEIAR